jgi:lysophospholipase L1-like esterase
MVALVALPTAWLAPVAAASPVGAPANAVYYLSLGDSLAEGAQPIGGPPTNTSDAGYNQGYADQLLKLVRDPSLGQLRLVKLGCGGESTFTMIFGGRCPYDAGSQLAQAVAFLDAHPGEVAFVTIDVGANDLFIDCGGDPGCAVGHIQAALPYILATLRAHAGPGVPIVGMNFYQPAVRQWFFDPALGPQQAQNAVAFSNMIEAIYAAAGSPVADVETAFSVTDFTDTAVLPGFGPVPQSVYSVCTLTWACNAQFGFNIHPNSAGYAVIAQAFATVLGF